MIKDMRYRYWGCSLFTTDYDKYSLLTAVLFVGRVSTVIVSIADPVRSNAVSSVGALEVVRSAHMFSCTRATND